MANNFKVPRGLPIEPIKRSTPPATQRQAIDQGFGTLLQKQLQSGSLKFSAHAEKRLAQSGIKLDAQQINLLEDAVAKVEQKGSKESLVLMNDLAFVVSVGNKTVITAIDSARMKDNVFTNIDSAIIT